MKICSRCKTKKDYDCFSKDKSNRDGYKEYCKCCVSELWAIKGYNKSSERWRKNNRALARKLAQRWTKNNPQKDILRVEKRRAKKNNAIGEYSLEEWNELCRSYGYKCACCRKERKLTVDHIVPISAGGSNFINNIQPLCLSCNDTKGTKIISYRYSQESGKS